MYWKNRSFKIHSYYTVQMSSKGLHGQFALTQCYKDSFRESVELE